MVDIPCSLRESQTGTMFQLQVGDPRPYFPGLVDARTKFILFPSRGIRDPPTLLREGGRRLSNWT